jgi:hypothetical protein
MKKMISIVMIVIFAVSTMVSIAEVQANEYTAWIGSPGDDTFSFCWHDGTYNCPNDTWVVLGMQAKYDSSNQYHYYWFKWDWESGVGGNNAHDYWWKTAAYPQFTYAYDQYGYWSGATNNAPGSPEKIGDRWYWKQYNYAMVVNPDAQKISGETQAVFWNPNIPATSWNIIVLPNPVYQMTARGPPHQQYQSGQYW